MNILHHSALTSDTLLFLSPWLLLPSIHTFILFFPPPGRMAVVLDSSPPYLLLLGNLLFFDVNVISLVKCKWELRIIPTGNGVIPTTDRAESFLSP